MGGTGNLPINPLSVHNLRYDIDRLEKRIKDLEKLKEILEEKP